MTIAPFVDARTKDPGRVRPHASPDFTADDIADLAIAHDQFRAACLALIEEYSDIPDAEVESAAQLDPHGLWSKLLRARRAKKAAGL